MRENFEIEKAGTIYECVRTVTGAINQTQRIEVLGVGNKNDVEIYGPNGCPASSMLSEAKIIAHEIVAARTL